jgi:hypothetical protein
MFVQFYLYVYWAFITPEIFIFTPFGVIYPGSPTPDVNKYYTSASFLYLNQFLYSLVNMNLKIIVSSCRIY